MIVVDTNVISEVTRAAGSRIIETWLDGHLAETLFVASTSVAEMLAGLASMPIGRRRADLELRLEQLLARLFADRVLPFDEAAARRYGAIAGRARAIGIAISMPDCQIAAIAESNGMIVATRDVRPFRGIGLRVVNPWESGA
jgi:predicted nucleic acid-binding protein